MFDLFLFLYYSVQPKTASLQNKAIETRLESMFIAKHDKSVSNGSSSQSRYHHHRYRTGICK